MKLGIDKRALYRGHVLSCHPELQDDGRFQARVAITSVDNNANFSQRFLDLDLWPTRELALERAHQAGIAWVDQQCASRGMRPGVQLPIR